MAAHCNAVPVHAQMRGRRTGVGVVIQKNRDGVNVAFITGEKESI